MAQHRDAPDGKNSRKITAPPEMRKAGLQIVVEMKKLSWTNSFG
jgi:hypothetical protein